MKFSHEVYERLAWKDIISFAREKETGEHADREAFKSSFHSLFWDFTVSRSSQTFPTNENWKS